MELGGSVPALKVKVLGLILSTTKIIKKLNMSVLRKKCRVQQWRGGAGQGRADTQ